MSAPEEKTAYILVVDGEVDQVCETQRDLQREKLELFAAGLNPKVYKCEWALQDRLIELIESGEAA